VFRIPKKIWGKDKVETGSNSFAMGSSYCAARSQSFYKVKQALHSDCLEYNLSLQIAREGWLNQPHDLEKILKTVYGGCYGQSGWEIQVIRKSILAVSFSELHSYTKRAN
jgi:hypothetical protein